MHNEERQGISKRGATRRRRRRWLGGGWLVGWGGGGPWEVAAGREMRDQKFISRGSAPLREFRWEQCRAPRQLGPNCWVPPKVGRRSEGGEDGAEKKVEEEAGRKGGGTGGGGQSKGQGRRKGSGCV
jgi:hypothetical protein